MDNNERPSARRVSDMVKALRRKCETALKQNNNTATLTFKETQYPSDVVHFVSELLKEGGTQVTLDWANGNHVLSLKKGA